MAIAQEHNGWTIVTLDGVVRDNVTRTPNRLAFKVQELQGGRSVWSVAADLDKKPGNLWLPPVGSDGMNRPIGFERLGDALAQAGLYETHMHYPQPDASVEAIAPAGSREFEHYVRFDVNASNNDRSFQTIMGALASIGLAIPRAEQMQLKEALMPMQRTPA